MSQNNTIGIDFIERLSGGNHELFHSNLLAYLAEHEPEFFKAIFSNPNATFPEYEEHRIGRDDLNLDFSLYQKGQEWINFVIENKMKSLPYKKQLERYQKKVKEFNKTRHGGKCRFVLLTLIEPSWNMPEWEIISYKELAIRMENNFLKLRCNSVPYILCFIRDYISYIKDTCESIEKEKTNIKRGKSLAELNDVSRFESWRAVLVKKAIYNAMANLLDEKCKGLDNVEIVMPFNHGAPILEALIYFDVKSKIQTESSELNNGKDDQEVITTLYFVHLDRKVMNRGFRIYDESSKNYKGRRKKGTEEQHARDEYLIKKWDEVLQSTIGKNIKFTLEDLKHGINLEEYYNSNNTKKAFVFDEFSMPYVSQEIDDKESAEKIIEKMAEEIKMVARICKNNEN